MTGAEVKKKLITIIGTTILSIGLSFGISFADSENTSQLILRVKNLTCSDCHLAISSTLLQLDKNIRMNSDRDKKSLIITYPDTLEDKEIVRAIQKLGYRVGIINRPQQGSKVAQTTEGSQVKYGYCTRSCNATANTWKQLYNRYFAENK
jgi:copper chaperone CopZ